MATCVPVRDMRDTAAFTELVDREGDVIVTKNGYTAMHCLSDGAYRLAMEEVAKARLLSRIMLAQEEIDDGLGEPIEDALATIRADHGL
ncbi:MAG: type II toxin-antitoxin system Phd/YefM family antitoxin [Collinsella sp.]|nr:type II toxin-antitoxin system Phd/YefM family antitoxin [Collinsella sp.]